DNVDESSDDDKDDDVDIKEDEGEEEHPTLADSIAVALPTVDQAPSAEETEPFETDESASTSPPHPAYQVARLLAIPSPPPSPLPLWLSPLPQIPSPPLLVSPLPLPASLTYPLGYRYAMIWLKAEAPSTSHPLPLPPPIILPRNRAYVAMLRAVTPSTYILTPRSEAPPSGTPPLLPIPLPTPSPPLLLPSTDRESSSASTARPDGDFRRDYGFIATLDDEIMRDPKRDDTDEVYGRLDDAYTERQMVTSQVNMLVRDRRAHARTTRLMEIEARMSREAWGWFMDASDVDPNEQILNSLA
ncbi:hypothetical protein Tco_1115238, partial [Tanacetum coccineum]